MTQLTMSAAAASARASSPEALERALGELAEHARDFARLDARSRAALVRACIPRVLQVAPAWSAHGLAVKGVPAGSGEEWLSGPVPTVRQLRLLADSLDSIAAHGVPPLGTHIRHRDDGRLEVGVFPGATLDRVLYHGFSGHVLMQEGVDVSTARSAQAQFYRQQDPGGRLALVLGAGNVSSIPAMDVLTKMFNEGCVCLLKMNPVNEWLGTYLEHALAPLIARGYLRVVYGGADVGRYLVDHEAVDTVHLTGSVITHDAMVWGAPGPDRDRRMAANQPLLRASITSELGNVTPVAVVPYRYSPDGLAFQARNVATMVTNNASFNCLSAKMLITARGWPQREAFLDLVARFLSVMPTRQAYYPGAADRYHALTQGRTRLRAIGQPAVGQLPWALISDLDPGNPGDPLFRTEPFCSIISETSVSSTDPAEFLAATTTFMNDTLWGTLSAAIVISPVLEQDATVAAALDRAVLDLRYGNVAINHWPALNYALASFPWGGHPSTSLHDIQSGLGWVHNTFMLGRVDKAVLRGPLRVRPAPVWFSDHPKAGRVGPKLLEIEARPSWRKIPGLLRRTV